jgi:4-carboxymuconolactone decarboxylase
VSRLPRPTPQDLDEAQRQLYASITSGARASGPQRFSLTDAEGRLEGPFNAMLLNPPIGDALQRLGAALRFEGRLSARAREVAVLTVAAHWDCSFERRAHEPIATDVGLQGSQLAAIRRGEQHPLDDPEEAAVYELTRRLLQEGDLDDASYERARTALGADRLFEVTTLVGYYSLLALQLRVFAVE